MYDSKDQKLIAALNTADSYLSGNQLGELLGMSRVAVGKRLHAMQSAGLPLKTKAATGYRLLNEFTPLDHGLIFQLLDKITISKLVASQVHITLDSTNIQIESIKLSSGDAGFVTSEAQSLGKGRRANNWISTPFQNIMLSLAWQFPVWPADITAFSLSAGVMVADVLKNAGVKGLQLKWPNDLYLNGAKIGGILINIQGESGAEVRLNCGIGLNIKMSDKDRKAIDQDCTDLYSAGHTSLDRNKLIAGLVNNWTDLCEQFLLHGFTPYSERWHRLHLFQNCDVIATKGNTEVIGRVTGVDRQGCLIIKSSDREETRLIDPEYSLRLL
jgi:BirA family transcriptional regulator, biotin operon repressor / biotin---[acetyl-CoA-carboxylase] ligase